MRQFREETKSICSSRRSLKSLRDTNRDLVASLEEAESNIRFAFDEVLKSSPVYLRAKAYAQAAPAIEFNSDPDIMAFSTVMSDTDTFHTATEAGTVDYLGLDTPPPVDIYGRRNILDAMRKFLAPNGSRPTGEVQICVLCGLAGIGKTFTAHDYVRTSLQQSIYGSVWWIRGETEISIAMSFSIMNSRLNLPDSTDPTVRVHQVMRWLGSTCKCSIMLLFKI